MTTDITVLNNLSKNSNTMGNTSGSIGTQSTFNNTNHNAPSAATMLLSNLL
jgi:hypothetical protein